MNTTILILYYSRGGATRKLAELLATGVESVAGCDARLRTVPPIAPLSSGSPPQQPSSGAPYIEAQDLQECDALALGSPTRFGNMAAPMKHFWDSTGSAWMDGALCGKPACVFTSSGSLHGGHESTLLSMMLPLLHHGMIITGIPYTEPQLMHTMGGGPYGAAHYAGADGLRAMDDDEKRLTMALGRRLAQIARKLQGADNA